MRIRQVRVQMETTHLKKLTTFVNVHDCQNFFFLADYFSLFTTLSEKETETRYMANHFLYKVTSFLFPRFAQHIS